MNVAFIIEEFPKLSETFILNQITGLIDFGHEVDIFAFKKSEEVKIHADITNYNLLNKVTYLNSIPEGRMRRAEKAIKIILAQYIFYPKEISRCLNYRNQGGKYYALNSLFMLPCFLKKKYDVIHCQFGPIGNRLKSLKYIFPKTAFVTNFRGYDFSKVVKKRGRNIYRDLFKKTDLMITVSKYAKERLADLGCNKEKIEVLHSGIEIEEFRYRQHIYRHNYPVKILTVSRLVEKKGLKYSIEAIAKLVNKGYKIEYNICGGGPLKNSLLDLIQRLNLKDNINLLGWKSRDEVIGFLSKAHLFVLPCITAKDGDQEGIPVSLMEAMAIGLPVISTYHSGIPELVINGKTGFLIPEKGVEAIKTKLEYLINHPEIWPEMGKAGRKIVEENFNIKKLNKRLTKIYKMALNNE